MLVTLKNEYRSSLVAQFIKDLVLSLLSYEFDPRPRNFHVLWVWQKKKKKSEYNRVFPPIPFQQ